MITVITAYKVLVLHKVLVVLKVSVHFLKNEGNGKKLLSPNC